MALINKLDADCTATDKTLTVLTAGVFPANWSFAALIKAEKIWVTNVSGVTLTCVRGYQGTTAAAYSSGEAITVQVDEQYIRDMVAYIDTLIASVSAHKDTHDPNDGSDALDTANAAEISAVVAAGTGTSHSLSRADHVHAINHGIADNHLVTVDDADAADNQAAIFTANGIEGVNVGIASGNMVKIDAADVADDEYARFTATGLESRTKGEVATDLKDQFPQAITDNHVITADAADIADDEYARFTANGLESRTAAEVLMNLMAGTTVLSTGSKIIFDKDMSTDGYYAGLCCNGVAGATLAFGDSVYYAVADSRWELTDADAVATSFGMLGICVLAAANDGDATRILLVGQVCADTAFPTFTVGAPVYLSSTAGDLTSTMPTKATNRCVRVVGQAWPTADDLWFNPDNEWLEYA